MNSGTLPRPTPEIVSTALTEPLRGQGGITPLGGQRPATVEIIHPRGGIHHCPLPEAKSFDEGTLVRCKMCGDVWKMLTHSAPGYGQWRRLSLWGYWLNRKALR